MTPNWRKSTRSGGQNEGQSDCVELAALPDTVGVRDSKNPEAGNLSLDPRRFSAMLTAVKAGKYDLS